MSSHPPPIPPAQRSGHEDGHLGKPRANKPAEGFKDTQRNLGEQGRQGNIKQNTTNKGLQQDR